jgi:hypothetical protein
VVADPHSRCRMDIEKKEPEPEDLAAKLNKYKPKKKKMAVPMELLDNANNYDDKLFVIKAVTEKKMKKVVRIVQGMLKSNT